MTFKENWRNQSSMFNPMNWTEVDNLPKISGHANAVILQKNREIKGNRAHESFVEKNGFVQAIADLKRLGIKEIRLKGYGNNAVVIEASENRAFRLRGAKTSDPNTRGGAIISQVLPPFYAREYESGCRMFGFPFLRTLDKMPSLSTETLNRIMEVISTSVLQMPEEHIFWDKYERGRIKYEQVGLLPVCNTPVLVDSGSAMSLVKYRDWAVIKDYERFNQSIIALKNGTVGPIEEINWDGRWEDDGVSRAQKMAQIYLPTLPEYADTKKPQPSRQEL